MRYVDTEKERLYLCIGNDDHAPGSEIEKKVADNGTCPFCRAEMIFEDFEQPSA